MCMRMCVASLKTCEPPEIALLADSAAKASRAVSFGIGALTPISRKAESMPSGRYPSPLDSPTLPAFAKPSHQTHALVLGRKYWAILNSSGHRSSTELRVGSGQTQDRRVTSPWGCTLHGKMKSGFSRSHE